MENKKAEVQEAILLHLRDLERQDLVSKAGAERLKFDLVRVLNRVIQPGTVHGIIFSEFVLQ
ncbi:MAG: flagellar basal body-associated FliL family protein [Rhodospirillaceae bacterium]